MSAFVPQWQSWVVVAEPLWPQKPFGAPIIIVVLLLLLLSSEPLQHKFADTCSKSARIKIWVMLHLLPPFSHLICSLPFKCYYYRYLSLSLSLLSLSLTYFNTLQTLNMLSYRNALADLPGFSLYPWWYDKLQIVPPSVACLWGREEEGSVLVRGSFTEERNDSADKR